ncbi:MAG: phosphoribosylanthranilate isomerase [Thermomicrobiales bacterium]
MSTEPGGIFIKTCGLRSAEAVEAAIGASVDAIGFMLAPSKRRVTIAEVVAIREALAVRQAPLPAFVAVTVNPTYAEIAAIVESGAFETIQLSGDEDLTIRQRIPESLSVWKALRPAPDEPVEAVMQAVATWLDGPQPVARVMLDAYHPGSYGGSGVTGNWAIAAAIAARYPIVLAGGLTPENVGMAIAEVSPFGVDVSSGIETDGVKDPEKIAAFVDAARRAPAISSTGVRTP